MRAQQLVQQLDLGIDAHFAKDIGHISSNAAFADPQFDRGCDDVLSIKQRRDNRSFAIGQLMDGAQFVLAPP